MKKIFLGKTLAVLTLCLGISSVSNAQAVFEKGNSVAGIGAGIWDYGKGSSFISFPIALSYEYCIKDNVFDSRSSIGIGGYLMHSSDRNKVGHYVLGLRGNLHYQFINKLDVYAGAMLMNTFRTRTDENTLRLAITTGARYYFSPKFGVFAETCSGIASLQAGAVLKF
jgi:hypothetical protein